MQLHFHKPKMKYCDHSILEMKKFQDFRAGVLTKIL